jgi:GAF domain-containing protein
VRCSDGRGELVVVDDVANSPIFVGTDGLDVMLEAGVRAVESMPYFTPPGQLAGTISMHHRAPGTRPKRDLMMLRLIAGRLGASWR